MSGVKQKQDELALPVERRYIEVLGVRTAYYPSFGGQNAALPSKPVVVLVHGAAPGASAALHWFNNYQAIQEAGYEVVAYDQPGFGYSASPNDHSIDFRYQHLAAFLNALELKNVHLVGNSVGGLLSTLCALRLPYQVAVHSLVLSAPFPYFAITQDIKDRLAQHRSRLRSMEPTFESVKRVCLNTFNQESCVTDAVVELRLAMLQGDRWDATQERAKIGLSFSGEDVAQRIVDTPTLLFWGVEDNSLPYEIGIQATKHYSLAQFHFLTQCGHWPQNEHPEIFNRMTVDFLGAQT